jgi:DNA polymerase-3 subunit epsilon
MALPRLWQGDFDQELPFADDGSDGRPLSWYVDVDEASQTLRSSFLRKEIYLRDVDPRIQLMSAVNRFSSRL